MSRWYPLLFSLIIAVPLGGCFDHKAADPSAYLARAEELKSAGDPAKARIELQNGLRIAPANPDLNLALAKIEEESGDLQAAIPYYSRAAAPSAHLREAQIRVTELLLDAGRLSDAAGRVNYTLGAFPNDLDALALRADVEERRDQVTSARNDALAVIQKAPNNLRALAVLARLDLRNNDSQSALNRVNAGLEKAPDDVRLLQLQAAAMMTANQPDKALEAWKNIVRVAPQNILARVALADLESRDGHPDQAIENFRSAVAADPTNQPMQLAFVRFLGDHGKPEDVIATLRKLIATSPTVNIYDLALAEFFRSRGQLNESRNVLAAAQARLANTPASKDIMTGLAKVDAQRGRIDLAWADLQAVLQADPANEEALLFKATLDHDGGRDTAAISTLLDILRTDPVSRSAYDQLAVAYFAQGQGQLAVDTMRRAVALAPGDDTAQIRLAAFLQSAGRLDDSRNIMAQLTLAQPDNPKVWSASGMLAIERKDWDGAARALNRVRALPDDEGIASNLDGEIKAARGDYVDAMKSFRKLIDARSGIDTAVIGQFARSAAEANRAAEAAAFLATKANTSDKADQAILWPAVLTLRADAGDFDGALDAFNRARSLTPTDVDLYHLPARILVGKGEAEQARQMLRQGITDGAAKWAMMMTMGDVDNAVGESKLAMTDYKTASDENPASIFAVSNYASLLANLDSHDVAGLTQARNRLNGQETSSNASILDTIAWLDYRLGRIDEAKLLLTRIDAQNSESPERRFHLAAVLLAAGEKAAGLSLLETVKGKQFSGSAEIGTLSPS